MNTPERVLSLDEEKVREAVEYMLKEDGLGLTKERIAADVPCSTTAVLLWASGERSPRPAYREKLAEIIEKAHGQKWAIKALRKNTEHAEARAT